GKAVGCAGCSSARYRDLGNVLRSERRLNDARDGAAEDAMRTRVFRVHWRIVDRLPSRLAVREVVAVNITITDGSDWAPEVIMVLGVEHGYERILEANGRERHEPRAVADTHLFGDYELTHEWMIGWCTDHEPEPGGLSLLRRTFLTILSAVILYLVVISCPFIARQ